MAGEISCRAANDFTAACLRKSENETNLFQAALGIKKLLAKRFASFSFSS
jgi:hypothetical protein